MSDEIMDDRHREDSSSSESVQVVDLEAPAPGAADRLNLGPGVTYELLGTLGQGGMAEVFHARRVGPAGFTREVAIKRIKPALATGDAQFAKMFLDEARLVGQLRHRGIAQVYDLHEWSRTFYLVMEYVDGLSVRALQRHAAEHGRLLSEAFACFIGAEAAEALDYAHSATEAGKSLGIVHRDVSPQNIMVSRRGEVKLLDFGIALSAAAGREQTEPGHVRGKFAYMSPEQARGERTLDGRSDLFALGIILVELLTGRRVFEGKTEFETMRQIVQETDACVERSISELPEGLRSVLRTLLARDVARRPRNGTELARALRAYLAAKGVLFDSADAATELATLTSGVPAGDLGANTSAERLRRNRPAPAPRVAASRRSRVLLATLGTVVLVGVAGAAAWRATRPPSTQSAAVAATVVPSPTPEPIAARKETDEMAAVGPMAPAPEVTGSSALARVGNASPTTGRSPSAVGALPRRRSLDSSTMTIFADAPALGLGRITLAARLLSPADPEAPSAVTAEVTSAVATEAVRIPKGAVLTCAARASGVAGRVGLACDTITVRGRAWGLEGVVIGEDLRPGLAVAQVRGPGSSRGEPAARGTPFHLVVSSWSSSPPGP
jgi:serine/threonine protein kinase